MSDSLSTSSAESSDGLSDDDNDDESSSSLSHINELREIPTTDLPTQKNSLCHTAFRQKTLDSEYARDIQRWVLQVPIGLGLCPWAGRSHRNGNLRYVTCTSEQPEEVMKMAYKEMDLLISAAEEADDASSGLCSTLLICPFVKDWKDFGAFEAFVNGGCRVSQPNGVGGMQNDLEQTAIQREEYHQGYPDKITLVPFHPVFLRWKGLPKGMGVGTVVQSHWGMVGRKSANDTAPATIIETENKVFGRQKVKIRFHQEMEGRRMEQYVPIDWIDHEQRGSPLPDNAMHQAPHPWIVRDDQCGRFFDRSEG